MTTPPDDKPGSEAALEALVAGLLRDLPDRAAPAALERRVLAELELRSRRPWWRRSHEHWPSGARAALLFVCAAAAVATAAAFRELAPGSVAEAVLLRSWRAGASAIPPSATDGLDALGAVVAALGLTWISLLLAALAAGGAMLAALGLAAGQIVSGRRRPMNT